MVHWYDVSTPGGSKLVVTVKGTNTIYVFAIDTNGIASSMPIITQAPGPALPTFFGFTFDNEIWLSPSFSAYLPASLLAAKALSLHL
jgi:hypothetical protein